MTENTPSDALVKAMARAISEARTGNSLSYRHFIMEAQAAAAVIADALAERDAEIARLRGVMREVFEEWAGSEGFIPETAPEAYLLQLTKRMADIASAALGSAKV